MGTCSSVDRDRRRERPMIFVLSLGFPQEKWAKVWREWKNAFDPITLQRTNDPNLVPGSWFEVEQVWAFHTWDGPGKRGKSCGQWSGWRNTCHPFCGCLESTKNFWWWFRIKFLKKSNFLLLLFSVKKPINQCLLKSLARQFPAAAPSKPNYINIIKFKVERYIPR